MHRALIVLAIAACGAPPAKPIAKPVLPPRLEPPLAGDPTARGASYLRLIAQQVQPRWATFLEDCRVRLPLDHPLNSPKLVAAIELGIARDGKLVEQHAIASSGNGDYETAISDVLGDAQRRCRQVPPRELASSDDELVHVRWQFARAIAGRRVRVPRRS